MREITNYKALGDFTLTQPKMHVSDPGYEKDTWCTATIDNCLTGQWSAFIEIKNFPYEYDGRPHNDYRVASLLVIHGSADIDDVLADPDDEVLSDNIGVDSGQAGFFDFEKYGDDSLFDNPGKCGFSSSSWYNHCCDATLKTDGGIIADVGVNASSGFGDGCYYVCGWKNSEGKIYALHLIFIDED